MITEVEIRHWHMFAGLGGGAKGFNRASPRVGNLVGKFRCIGGVDVDADLSSDGRTTAETACFVGVSGMCRQR